MRIAFFDFDHTLVSGDSNELWYEHLRARGLIQAAALARHDGFMADYRAGTLDFDALQRFRAEVDAGLPADTLERERRAYVHARLLPILSADAVAHVRAHQAAGDRVVIVSATRRCLIEAVAERLGIADLITAEPGELVAGQPCFAEGKVAHVQAWLARHARSLQDLDASWFYSDSSNDIPLLTAVRNPVAVTPDPRLLRLARERGWAVVGAPPGAR